MASLIFTLALEGYSATVYHIVWQSLRMIFQAALRKYWNTHSFNRLKLTGYVMHQQFNLLKPTGYAMHQQFNIQQLYVLPTLYLCVLYLSENKQRLVPLTA